MKRAGPYYGSKVKGHSWQTRSAAEVLKQKSDAFESPAGVELVNALRGHRLSQGNAPVYGPGAVWFKDADPTFDLAAHLDLSMIDDRRGEKKAKPNPFVAQRKQLKRKKYAPPPKPKPTRPVNQGRHDEATAKPSKQGAFSGDGRLERPAPKATHKLGAAGSSAARPKKKPITNQGRHDG